MDATRVLLTSVLLAIVVKSSHAAKCNPSREFQCVSDGSCIRKELVCNNVDNCDDNSDERNCSYPPVDIAKALVYATTDRLSRTSTLHRIFGKPADYARKLSDLARHSKSIPINVRRTSSSKLNFFDRIAVDHDTDSVYFANNGDGVIHAGQFVDTGSQLKTLPAIPISKQINGISYDWSSTNIYWTDGLHKLIGVANCRWTRSFWTPVVDSRLTSPQDVATHPVLGYLFWSDGNGTTGKIERSDLSGNNRVVLLNSTQGLVAPTTLVVDFTSQRLYWLDAAASTLGAVNFDGSHPQLWRNDHLRSMSCFSVVEGFIFFGDQRQSKVFIYNKTDVSSVSSISVGSTGPVTDMATYSADSQPTTTSPCAVNNGGCSQLCVTTSTTSRVCRCAVGYFIGSDRTTCSPELFSPTTNLVIVADDNQQNIYQIDPATSEIRAMFADGIRTVALDVDADRRLLYVAYSHLNNDFIHRVSFDGGVTDEAIFSTNNDRSRLVDISLDSSRGLLYYTDSGLGIVGELSVSGVGRTRTVVSGQKPTAVAIDTYNREVYWSDCPINQPSTINVVNLIDGRNQRIVINGTRGSCIRSLVIDANDEVMYWTNVSDETSSVVMSSLHGSRVTTLYSEHRVRYTGLTLSDRWLYIADSARRSLVKLDLTERRLVTQQPAVFSRLSALVSYSPQHASTKARQRSTTRSSSPAFSSSTPTGTVLDTRSHGYSTDGLAIVNPLQQTSFVDFRSISGFLTVFGVAVGGVVLVLVLITVIVIVCIATRFKLYKRFCRQEIQRNEVSVIQMTAIKNETYDSIDEAACDEYQVPRSIENDYGQRRWHTMPAEAHIIDSEYISPTYSDYRADYISL